MKTMIAARRLRREILKKFTSVHDFCFRVSNKIFEVISPRNLGMRIDTYPMLSSDAYSLRLSKAKNKSAHWSELIEIVKGGDVHEIVYIPGALVNDAAEMFTKFGFSPEKIVIGDDDVVFFGEELRRKFPRTRVVHAVNLKVNNDYGFGIPLGLESPSYRNGGRLRDFKGIQNSFERTRSIGLLIAWNPNTNLEARTIAMRELSQHPEALVLNRRVSPQSYHMLLRRTKFVACPRGNGLDTHRVWEALYLGAVPVIRKADYFAALDGWPIWVVESWQELNIYSSYDFESKYCEFSESIRGVLEKSIIKFREITEC